MPMKLVEVFNAEKVGSEMVIRAMIWMNVTMTVNWLERVLLDSEILLVVLKKKFAETHRAVMFVNVKSILKEQIDGIQNQNASKQCAHQDNLARQGIHERPQ